ncbi:glutamate receptor, ionotropic kainate 2-like protein 3 [Sarcoptes scabiei]|uniref:Glutamate receptor 1 n=1 Tax=Sarcoptes scabiei TaxID=52283 RepID=A0A132A473_SARSC|nr:glutamate receptor, ionotropic kainate 2-like protein 3 [Sarcoptes scabiei]
MAFRDAVAIINADDSLLPNTRIEAIVERLEPCDSFQASKRVCSLLRQGAAAIFGPQTVETTSHVQSTCDVLHMVHMETTQWNFKFDDPPFHHSVNLFPHPLSLGNAFRDLITLKNWKSFAILYEENEALVRMQEILKDPSLNEKRIVVRQFASNEYRTTFKELHKLAIRNIIIDVRHENILTVLRHAQQVDMLSAYHNYFFISLDVHTVDLEEFQYSGLNISGFSLIDFNSKDFMRILSKFQKDSKAQYWNDESTSPQFENIYRMVSSNNFTTEVALVYDAVRLFAQTLYEIDKNGMQLKPPEDVSCESENAWKYGTIVSNYMRNIEMDGITGPIKFDFTGSRSDFRLQLLELTREGLKHVGDWQPHKKITFMSNYTKAMTEIYRESLRNKTLTIVTIGGEPYCMEVEDAENRTGNDRFEGYSVDLIKEISDLLEFKYTIKLVEDGVYGKRNERGEWNGMIRELIEGKADMAIADLTITYEREAAVDFTMPFMSLGIGILYKRQKKEPPTLFSFMSPLAMDVWVYLMTSFLGVTLFLFFVARFSPYEWVNPHPCNKDPLELKNNFSMKNTLWFTIGCLMQQGCDIMPRSLSTRVLAASWWFFILILVSSYTANLAAFLTVERMVNPIESAEDLSKQTKIPYGCLKSGSTEAFFRSSNFSTYARMWSFMESYRPSVFVESNKKGVDRVEKGNYAFLMESTSIEYIVERKCDLFQVGSLLDSKGYGIATPPDSPYRSIVSDAILKLQEEGKLLMLKNRWWSGKGKCGGQKETQKVSVSASELGLANVGGVFVVLAAGSIIAIIICVGEFIWKMGNIPRSEREHIGIELLREIKYVICCYGNTRPIRKVYDWDPTRSLIIEPACGQDLEVSRQFGCSINGDKNILFFSNK